MAIATVIQEQQMASAVIILKRTVRLTEAYLDA